MGNNLPIVGAGMAGLLAGNILRRHSPAIFEKQKELPNNHSAVLRFRSSVVGDATGIPFRKVNMIKATMPYSNPIADALMYSFKNLGVMRSDRSVSSGLVVEPRYIAPPNLIARLASDLQIIYNTNVDFKANTGPIISTIPMPALMKALDYPKQPEFKSLSGINVRASISNCDAYVSLVVPDPGIPFSRLSITGDELIIEATLKDGKGAANDYVTVAARLLSIPLEWIKNITSTMSQYQKLVPLDDDERKQFIFWATDNFNIFSLGRFATWRPNLLLDDLVKDCHLIDRWLQKKDRYSISQHRSQ